MFDNLILKYIEIWNVLKLVAYHCQEIWYCCDIVSSIYTGFRGLEIFTSMFLIIHMPDSPNRSRGWKELYVGNKATKIIFP